MNNKKVEVFSSSVFLAIAVACLIIHFIFFRYSFPPVDLDEASFFSPAYSFASKGVLSSDVHGSFLPGGFKYTYWMPPFYMTLLGILLKVIGITVFNAKLVSLLFICLAAFLISFVSKDWYIKICLISLLLICPFVLITSAYVRMEALSVLLIVISILAVKNKCNEYLMALLASVLIMTHPMLLPSCAAIGIIMLRRGIKRFILFSCVTLIALSPYIFYIFKDIHFFEMQMALQLERKSNAKLRDLKLSYILQSVPLFCFAIFCLQKLKGFKDLKLFLAVASSLTLLLVLKSNEFNYQVYLVAYVLASIGLLMTENSFSKVHRYLLPGAIYCFFSLILLSKAIKYNFLTDESYKAMLTYLEVNKGWNGKNIYVTGNPDVSTYFLMNNQNVERQNAVASAKTKNWFSNYNYVVEVKENYNREEKASYEQKDSLTQSPWLVWPEKVTYTTPDSLHSLEIYAKP